MANLKCLSAINYILYDMNDTLAPTGLAYNFKLNINETEDTFVLHLTIEYKGYSLYLPISEHILADESEPATIKFKVFAIEADGTQYSVLISSKALNLVRGIEHAPDIVSPIPNNVGNFSAFRKLLIRLRKGEQIVK